MWSEGDKTWGCQHIFSEELPKLGFSKTEDLKIQFLRFDDLNTALYCDPLLQISDA